MEEFMGSIIAMMTEVWGPKVRSARGRSRPKMRSARDGAGTPFREDDDDFGRKEVQLCEFSHFASLCMPFAFTYGSSLCFDGYALIPGHEAAAHRTLIADS